MSERSAKLVPTASSRTLEVVAAVLRDASGRVLLAQRPAGREDAGLWEFPGGKREHGETAAEALARELAEELAIDLDPRDAEPLIRVPQRQPHRMLWLEALQSWRWRGEPRALEGQRWAWRLPETIDPLDLPAADRPILAALLQPCLYWITPESLSDEAQLAQLLQRAVAGGAQRLQLRAPSLSERAFERLARAALHRCAEAGIELLLNARSQSALALAAGLGCGAQLAQPLLMSLQQRPPLRPLGASCHDLASLQRAEVLGCDFALLSPVNPTRTHPDATALGWQGFVELRAATALPVYALGGLGPADLGAARAAGAQGIAAIRGLLGD